MIQVFAGLVGVDYEKLLLRIHEHKKKQTAIPPWLLEVLGRLLTSPAGLALNLIAPLAKGRIIDFSGSCGVYFSELIIRDVNIIKTKREGRNMLDISVSVASVEWDKLADTLIGRTKSGGNGNTTLQDLVRIVKPFIAETMATIPPAAIVELFGLFAKEKAIELAGRHGIVVSDISVTP